MKRSIAVVVLVLFMSTPVFAYKRRHVVINNNTTIVQDEKQSTPMGVGTDVVVWEGRSSNVLEDVTAQYRYDANNVEHSLFGVVRVNPWKLLNKGE